MQFMNIFAVTALSILFCITYGAGGALVDTSATGLLPSQFTKVAPFCGKISDLKAREDCVKQHPEEKDMAFIN